MLPFRLLIAAVGGWLHGEQADVIAIHHDALNVLPLNPRQRRELAALSRLHTVQSGNDLIGIGGLGQIR